MRTTTLPFDPGAIRRLSEKLLLSHHENNHSGAVKRLNAIRTQWRGLQHGSAPGVRLNGLKQEELVATNAMLLYELYFGSMGGEGAAMAAGMKLALEASFGSVGQWQAEFIAMGKALGGGSGWVLLVFQARDGTLVNQ